MIYSILFAFVIVGAGVLLLRLFFKQHTYTSCLTFVIAVALIYCVITVAPLTAVSFLFAAGVWYLLLAVAGVD